MKEYLPGGNRMKAKDWPGWEAFKSVEAILAEIQKLYGLVMQSAVAASSRIRLHPLRLKVMMKDGRCIYGGGPQIQAAWHMTSKRSHVPSCKIQGGIKSEL